MLMYADDTTLYCNFNKDINEMIINRKLYKVCTWLSANKLALNVSKTKFIMFRTLNKGMHYPMLKLNDTVIERVDKCKFLGTWLDEYLNWGAHIDHVCFKISRMNGTLNILKHHCPQTVLMILYNTLILRHINYGILLWGAKVNKVHKMHLLQKKTVRLITSKSPRESIGFEFHWLPVTKRCQYKLMVLTYKTLIGTTPVYICDMLNWYNPSRPLRSGAFLSLTLSRHNTITYGRRLCDTATAKIWNNLPVKLRCTDSLSTFKRQFKTHQVLIP